MIGFIHLILFIFILLFAISIAYECRVISFVCSIFIVFHSEYNLKIRILTHFAGYCSALYSKTKVYFKNHYYRRSRTSVYCSTPEMQNRYSTGIFKNESLLSPIRKSDQCGSTNGGLLNMSHELGSNSRPSRLSR